jgi:hypothetical protein
MSLITKVAFLEICVECEKHGRIILPDGSCTRPFMTKTAGMERLKLLREQCLISEEEERVVRDEIDRSALIEHSPLVEEAYQEFIDAMLVPIGFGTGSTKAVCLH